MATVMTLNPVGSSQPSSSSSAIARNGDQGKGWQLTHSFTKAEYDAAGGFYYLVPSGARGFSVQVYQSASASTVNSSIQATCQSHEEVKSGTVQFGANSALPSITGVTAGSILSFIAVPCTALRVAIGGTGNVSGDSYTVSIYAVATIRA